MIRTERLLLRRFRDADRGAYAALNQDPIVATWESRQAAAPDKSQLTGVR